MAGNILADLSLRLSANTAELQRGLATAKASLNGFKGQVSNIKSAVSDGFKEASRNVGNSLNAMTNGLSGMLQTGLSAFKGLISGVKGFSAAFAATGIGAIILAITTAISGLVAAFKRSGTAADEMEKALGFLKGILNYLVNILVKVGEWIVKVFTDPQTAIKELWAVIKENLVTRFQGVIQLFQGGWEIIKNGAMGVAYAIKGIFDKEAREQAKSYFDAAAEGAKKVGEAVIMITTGKTIEDIKKIGKEIGDAGREGVRIAKMENDLETLKLKTLIQNGDARRKLGDLIEQIAETNTTTTEGIAKKQELVNAAAEQQRIITKNNVALKQAEYDLLKAQLKQKSGINLTDEDALKLEEKRQEIIDAQYEGQKAISALKRKDTALDQKAIADAEKAQKEAEDAAERLMKLKHENVLLQIKDEQTLQETKLAFERDDLLRASKNAKEQEYIWDNYWLALGKLRDEYLKDTTEKVKDAVKTWQDFDQRMSRETLDYNIEDTKIGFFKKLKILKKYYQENTTLFRDNFGIYAKELEAIKNSGKTEEEQMALRADAMKKYYSAENDAVNLSHEYNADLMKIKDEEINKWTAWGQVASDAIAGVSMLNEAALNRDLEAAKKRGASEEQLQKIKDKYAKREKAMAIAQAIINGAVAITKAFAQTGILGPISAAVIAGVTAAQVALISSQPLAKGGIAYGPTLATVGEYPGAKNNPEVIAPLDKLQSLLTNPFKNMEVKFVIEQDQLVGILNNYDNKHIYF